MDDHAKYCPACQEWKARSEFYRNRATSDGLQSYCKPCLREKLARPPARNAEASKVRAARTRADTMARKQIAQQAEALGVSPESLKICGRCRALKTKTEFYRNSRMVDGRDYYCKACRIEATRTSLVKRAQAHEQEAPAPAADDPWSGVVFVPTPTPPPPKTCYCGEIFFGDGDMCAPCQRAAD